MEEKATKTIGTLIYFEDGKKTLLYNLEWKVLNIGSKGGRTLQTEIDLLYAGINFCYLLVVG